MLTTVCSYASNMRVLSTVLQGADHFMAAARALPQVQAGLTTATRMVYGHQHYQRLVTIITES